MKGQLTLFIMVFLVLACFASAQDFYASGNAAINVCACSSASTGFVVNNTGSSAGTFIIRQSGDALKYSVSAPLSFTLMPNEAQIVATVFSAPCGSAGRSFKVSSRISNGINAKMLTQQFNVQQCTNATNIPSKKPSFRLTAALAAIWSTTGGKALVFLPIMVIIIVLVVAMAKRLADSLGEKKAEEQPRKIVLKEPKHYSWEKMFKADEEPEATEGFNWKLVLLVASIILVIVLLVSGAYWLLKTGFLQGSAKWFLGGCLAFFNYIWGKLKVPIVRYVLMAAILAFAIIAVIFFMQKKGLSKYWKWAVFAIVALMLVAVVWYFVYMYWFQLGGFISKVMNYLARYWIYIISGLVVLGVIIAIILAVRSEDEPEVEEIIEVPVKSRKRKK